MKQQYSGILEISRALDSLEERERANAEVIEVPAGVLVLRAERPSEDGPKPDRWWVIQDRPGLSGTEIRSPEQSFDQGVNNQPIVTFNFTDKGREAFRVAVEAWMEVTRALLETERMVQREDATGCCA